MGCLLLLLPLSFGVERALGGLAPAQSSTPQAEAAAGEPLELPVLNTQEHVVYLEGHEDKVRPDDSVTRAEAAKMLYTLLEDPAPGEEDTFSDVEPGQWYESYVDSLAALGVLSGYEDGSFQPQRPITRGEFAAVLSRLLPQETPSELDLAAQFPDVEEDHWAYAALCQAVDQGWLSGFEDGTLQPNAPVTRAQAVAMLNRLLGRSADEALLTQEGPLLQFVDLPLDHWAYFHIAEASIPHQFELGETETWTEFDPPQAQRAPGCYLEQGQLYCVGEDGFYLRDASLGVLTFDEAGRYTSGDQELDQYLTDIVLEVTDPQAAPKENLEAVYRYVCDNAGYRGADMIPEGSSQWEEKAALTAFQAGNMGNCYSYAAMVTMLARKLGFQASAISGEFYTDLNGSTVVHGWCEIQEGDQLYLCDAEVESVYAANRDLSWDLFYQPYGATPTRYFVFGEEKL